MCVDAAPSLIVLLCGSSPSVLEGQSASVSAAPTAASPAMVRWVACAEEQGECLFAGILPDVLSGKVVCHFKGTTDCGGRNCGSHGVCVHLPSPHISIHCQLSAQPLHCLRKEYQNTFDTGNSSFRCSCNLSCGRRSIARTLM